MLEDLLVCPRANGIASEHYGDRSASLNVFNLEVKAPLFMCDTKLTSLVLRHSIEGKKAVVIVTVNSLHANACMLIVTSTTQSNILWCVPKP